MTLLLILLNETLAYSHQSCQKQNKEKSTIMLCCSTFNRLNRKLSILTVYHRAYKKIQ